LSFSIKFYQIKGNFLDTGLGFLLKGFPGFATQFVHLGSRAILAVVFGYFMQGMNAEVKNVAFAIYEFYSFLFFSFDLYFLKSAKFSYSVIYMGYIIAYFQLSQLLKGNGLLFSIAIFKMKFVIALKNLMVCITNQLVVVVNKSLV